MVKKKRELKCKLAISGANLGRHTFSEGEADLPTLTNCLQMFGKVVPVWNWVGEAKTKVDMGVGEEDVQNGLSSLSISPPPQHIWSKSMLYWAFFFSFLFSPRYYTSIHFRLFPSFNNLIELDFKTIVLFF